VLLVTLQSPVSEVKKVKLSLCLTKHYAMKACGGVASALVGSEWSDSRPGRFTFRGRAPGTHWIGGWICPRAGLDDVEKRIFLTLPGLEFRPLSRQARSQSLYRLRYPGSVSEVPISNIALRNSCCNISSWCSSSYTGESRDRLLNRPKSLPTASFSLHY
jgi:hypothetical protein